MRSFNYYSPTEIVFGKNAEENVGVLCKKQGAKKVFIVYGKESVVKSGLLDRVIKSIEHNDIEVLAMGGVVPNPRLSLARKMIAAAIEFNADLILGVGGGSAIDTAKMVAHGTANPDIDAWEFWSGTPVEKSLPIGCVLTLPATGTETSNSSVISNDDVTPIKKRGITTEKNRCVFAALNPELCMTLPEYQIGAGVSDIFMHNAERFFTNILGNHLTDEISLGLSRNIMKYGKIALENPKDYEAMSEVVWSGTIAHIGLTGLGAMGNTSREGDWSCHQLGHSLSSLYDATHGASLTAVFPSWAEYVMDADYSRFALFGREVLKIEEQDDEICAKKALDGIKDFFVSLKMPINITDLIGHTPSDKEIEDLAFHCSYEKTRTIGTFKILEYDDIKRIYENAK